MLCLSIVNEDNNRITAGIGRTIQNFNPEK